MRHFIEYTVKWIAGNLSIPFWMVGHVHLSLNVYKDIYEILTSIGMNILVGFGFYLEWKEYKQQKNEQNRTNA